MSRYSQAKQIALGLKANAHETGLNSGKWNMASSVPPGLQTDMPFQFFDKKLAPPSDVLAHKAALSLFSEYTEDRRQACIKLQALSEAFREKNHQTIARLLKKNPAAEWLSFIFLEPEELQAMLWEPILQSDEKCREVVLAALKGELARLRAYTDLLGNIIERISECA